MSQKYYNVAIKRLVLFTMSPSYFTDYRRQTYPHPLPTQKAMHFFGKKGVEKSIMMTETNITVGHRHSTIVLKIYLYFSYDTQWLKAG